MFCPKCNYTSFDHLPTCPKCAYDWSPQKKIFNMEWMVPTATEGINIFTPASPETQAQAEQIEATSSEAAAAASGPASQQEFGSDLFEASDSDEGEIDLQEADLEDVGEGLHQAHQADTEHSPAEETSEVDDEISFEGLQDFFSDLTDEAEDEAFGKEAASATGNTVGEGQESDLEIEIDDPLPQEEEKTEEPGEPASMEQDDLDLDITSILDDIEDDSGDKDSGGKS